MLPEDELVDLIARAAGSSREVLVGIGDDAAVLAGGLVASTDILVEGVHFDSGAMDARSIGHRAAAERPSGWVTRSLGGRLIQVPHGRFQGLQAGAP